MAKSNTKKDKRENKKQKSQTNQVSISAQEDELRKFLGGSVGEQKNTTQQSEELGEFLTINTDEKDIPEVDEQKSTELIKANTHKSDHDALNTVLLEILSPQLSRNEVQKRTFKQTLTKYILWILGVQLGVIAIPIICCFLSICTNWSFMKTLTLAQTDILFSFLKYYITAIIVEFIAMLFFIVKFVFDKSIVDLMKGLLKK